MADMDGDGKADVVGMSYFGGVTWFNTNGSGPVFEKHVIHSGANGYFLLRLLDWDGDQDIDVLYGSYFQGLYYWQANDGSGQFGPQQELFLNSANLSNTFFPADFNGDGHPDLMTTVVAGDSIKPKWYANDGTGQIAAEHPLDYGIAYGNPFDIIPIAIDLENDGDPDLVWFFSPFEIARSRNDGAGNFSAPEVIIADSSLYPTWLTAADFDGDGDEDLYPMNLNYGGLAYFPNDGSGNFGPAVMIADSNAFEFPFTVADFSGDGKPDILIQDVADNYVLFTNNGPGVPFSQKIYPWNQGSLYSHLSAGDPDADGDTDVLLVRNNTPLWIRNDGSGNLEPPAYLYPEIIASIITSADLDGDGFTDYIVGDQQGEKVGWYRNNGDGTFGALRTISVHAPFVQYVVAADLDSDGDIDILTNEHLDNSGAVRWYANDGSGQFGPAQGISNSNFNAYLPVFALDMDNDQDTDVVSGAGIYFNDGTGYFDSIVPLSLNQAFLPGDLDYDGDQDILLSYGQTWMENDGQGVFFTQQTNLGFQTVLNLSQAQLIDMDGDSIPEIIESSHDFNVNQIRQIKNLVTGSSTEIKLLLSAQTGSSLPYLLQSADMDADGRLDLLIGFGEYWSVWWNGGQGAFETSSGFALEGIVAPADFDNDGIPDLQCVIFDGNEIGWMRSYVRDFYLSGVCFWDENENGIRDSTEAPLQHIGVTLLTTGQTAYSNAAGEFRLFADPSIQHDIQFAPNFCWQYSSDPAMLTLPPAAGGHRNLEYGFVKTGDTTAVRLHVMSAPTRCGTVVPFWLDVQNVACRQASGRFCLLTDALTTFQSASPVPDQITPGTAGRDTLWWYMDSLLPSQTRHVELLMLMPDANHVGDSIYLDGFLLLKNEQQQYELAENHFFASEIRCAFDPNDKLVHRAALPPDYEPQESELLYTIRFQNTGNDTARVVSIRDTLDFYLDLNTFRPLGASHAYRCELKPDWRVAEFIFDDIALADSNVNEPASHGFVSFSIQPYSGLGPGGIIPNRADIYFDNNPPVVTNTATTTVLTPVSVKNARAQDWPISIYPNPNAGTFSIELPEAAGKDMLLRICAPTGQLLLEKQAEAGAALQMLYMRNSLPGGMYFLHILSDGKVLAAGKFVKQ